MINLMQALETSLKGGLGSGNHGHVGRPGKVGGSASQMGGVNARAQTIDEFGKKAIQVSKEIASEYANWYQGFEAGSDIKHPQISDRVQFLEDHWRNLELNSPLRSVYVDGLPQVPGKAYYATNDDKIRSDTKREISEMLSEKTGVDVERCARVLDSWAASSNDDNFRSLSLQEAAAEEFHLELSDWQKTKLDKARFRYENFDYLRGRYQEYMMKVSDAGGRDEGAKEWGLMMDEASKKFPKVSAETLGEAFSMIYQKGTSAGAGPVTKRENERKILRVMYDETQSRLKKGGFGPDDMVPLYRGASIPYKNTEKQSALRKEGAERIGSTIKYRGNAMESWTYSPDVARGFGNTFLAIKVKRKNVLCYARTGFGCLPELEFVVLGNNDIEALIYHG